MKILFDQGTPVPLRRYLTGHSVHTAFERGWAQLQNGELLEVCEQEGFQIFISTDQNLRYQQNLSSRQLAIIILLSTSWPRIERRAEEILGVVGAIDPGEYREISI
ncbi:MAG: hypothetical protein GKR89_00170 [Candidatus Latescibacteria bacterium]|nr:hypothetical protein [Candidatus Latescibacterota bacterium]